MKGRSGGPGGGTGFCGRPTSAVAQVAIQRSGPLLWASVPGFKPRVTKASVKAAARPRPRRSIAKCRAVVIAGGFYPWRRTNPPTNDLIRQLTREREVQRKGRGRFPRRALANLKSKI